MINRENYPKTCANLHQWLIEQSKLQGQSPEILAVLPMDKMVDSIFLLTAPILREYLDKFQIHTGIWPVEDITSGTIVWKWKVVGGSPTMESSSVSRAEAEDRSYNEGLKRLEARL